MFFTSKPDLRAPSTNFKLKVYRRNATMLDKLGWTRVLLIVWRCTPFPLRVIALPYGVVIYTQFFAASETPEEVSALHARKYTSSQVFRWLRPRNHKVRQLLG